MKTYRQVSAIALAGALLLAACTSDPDDAASSGGGETGAAGEVGSTTGITEDTIKVGMIGADFGALAEAGLAPDLGDQTKIAEATVAEINADGGVNGRQIELKVELVDGVAGPEAGQAVCLEMTEDFGAAVVVVAPAVSRNVVRCLSVTQQTLVLGGTGFDQAMYDEADGRLFTAGTNTSMTTDRQAAGWAQLLDAEGMLEGKTIGVVDSEQLPEIQAAVENGLLPTLETLGYDVAEYITLPSATGDTDCDQHEAAAQKLKAAGVDLVFMAAANIVGPTLIQAADNLDYAPEWVANGNQMTDTVSQFFEPVKASWDGTVGTSTAFNQDADITDEARSCNEVIAERTDESYEAGSDAFGQAAAICILLRTIDTVGEELEPDALGQASLIAGIEGLGEVELNAGPAGSLSKDKHAAGDYLFLADFSAEEGKFIARPGDPYEVEE